MGKLKLGILGMGRIGKVHLKNLLEKFDNVDVLAAVNPSEGGQDFARQMGVKNVSDDPAIVFENSDINAVMICSPTDSHAYYIKEAVKSGKSIFCEKPIDLSLPEVKKVVSLVEESGTSMMVAFNQRYDNEFLKIKEMVVEGRLGDLRTIKITSRDPSPPPISYIKSSGGLFQDMTIHDFDMARHIANSEVVSVYAQGQNLIDPEIGKAGDIDTGLVLLNFESGCTAVIENSRQSTYGYDQRIEVFGSNGMIKADNNYKSNHLFMDIHGQHGDRPLDDFMLRYVDSYYKQMCVFIEAISMGVKPPVNESDGLKASAIAEAANLSMKENRPVKMSEIL